MSKGKGYNDYKSIDDNYTEENLDLKKLSQNEEKFNTLDSYNDDMSKKAVNNLFKGYVDKGGNKKVDENTESFSEVSNKESENFVESLKNKKYDDDIEFVGYHYDSVKKEKGHDFRNTNFSTEKIRTERAARDEVKKNKEILKKMEKPINPKIISSNEKNRKNSRNYVQKPISTQNRKKKSSYLRIATLCALVLLLITIIFLTLKNNGLNRQVKNLNIKIDDLQATNSGLSKLELDNQNLRNQIAELTGVDSVNNETSESNVSTSDDNTEDIANNNTDVTLATPIPTIDPNQNTQTTTLPTTYTVTSKDTLSSISKKFYGDPNKYGKIIAANNGMKETDHLIIGQKIIIPK